jgi:hypothetical protein
MKPMSDKQRHAIRVVEDVLKLKYDGSETAQGAFLWLRDNVPKAEEVYVPKVRYYFAPVPYKNPSPYSYDPIIDEMARYGFDDSHNGELDEDAEIGETPTIESLQDETARFLRYF